MYLGHIPAVSKANTLEGTTTKCTFAIFCEAIVRSVQLR